MICLIQMKLYLIFVVVLQRLQLILVLSPLLITLLLSISSQVPQSLLLNF